MHSRWFGAAWVTVATTSTPHVDRLIAALRDELVDSPGYIDLFSQFEKLVSSWGLISERELA